MNKKRISTKEKHECEKISGKVYHLAMDRNDNPYCGYCNSPVIWTQVPKKLHIHSRDKERWRDDNDKKM